VPTQYHLSEADEKLRYDTHENNPKDIGYRAFLSKALLPVVAHIEKNQSRLLQSVDFEIRGLDFGCGPGPTLSLMFEEVGYKVDLFDVFYADNPKVFERQYDFITATEVVEHLSNPRFEMNRLFGMLKDDGILVVMTQRVTKAVDFALWYYKNDPTHICFFSEKTMHYLAQQWCVEVKFLGDNVALFFKS